MQVPGKYYSASQRTDSELESADRVVIGPIFSDEHVVVIEYSAKTTLVTPNQVSK